MLQRQVDLAVIGAGPAGQKGAIQAAKLGKKVVVVDAMDRLGGACLNQGTIPSKTLREAILDLTGFRNRSYYGRGQEVAEISIHDLNFRLQKVIEDQHLLIARQFAKNDIECVRGFGRFVSDDCIEVVDSAGEVVQVICADRFLIATGSRPRNPEEVPFDGKTILNSNSILELEYLPESMLVLGGGIIGCEYGTMFAALGTRVTLIDKTDRPLSLLDKGIGRRFGQYIEEMGVELKMLQTIKDIRRTQDGLAEVEVESGEVFRAQCMFYALGRQANVEGLQLEKAGIWKDSRGFIEVNPLFQSTNARVYAAGDTIGKVALASTAMEEGRLAVRNAFALKTHQFPEFFPYGIYTIPEVSGVGPTEEELQAQDINYQIGLAYYYELGRGPIAGDTTGMFKLIFHAETLEVLAVHIIGSNATELIHIGQLAIDFHARVHYFINQVFNYPTFAEGYRIAALNGLNKLADRHKVAELP
jgi:NAD(P) transhydrogenase